MGDNLAVFSLPYAYGEPALKGVIRTEPGDFCVEEQLAFTPEGEGEHVFLYIEKIGLNTEQVAKRIAQCASVSPRLVSYSGLKDRRAVTRQWFSVHLPGKQVYNWEALQSDQLQVLETSRHRKKLRRGVHRANRFILTIRQVEGDIDSFAERLAQVRQHGVPNYFGEQRFGHQGENIRQAERWFSDEQQPSRHLRSLYLSAVRAGLFNRVLARRVEDNNWSALLAGDLLMLEGSHSLFLAEEETDSLRQRLQTGDIHATGPLYGVQGKLTPQAEAADLEQQVLAHYDDFCKGLESKGMKAERRALRVIPQAVDYHWSASQAAIQLSFELPSGCFATAVMRELVRYQVATLQP